MFLRSVVTALLVLLVPFASPAFADRYYLQLPGVPGEVTDSAFRDQIELDGYRLDALNVINVGSTGGGGGAGRAQLAGLEVVKVLDRSSPYLLQALVRGQPFPSATLSVVDETSGTVYLTVDLTVVYVEQVREGGRRAQAGRPLQTVLFQYGSIEYRYTAPGGGDEATCWDQVANGPC